MMLVAHVKNNYLLEIAVESLEAAEAAQRAGASRIELCADLREGGTTPPIALVEAVRKTVNIPIFVMVRPRAGDFVYSAVEFEEMKAAIVAMKGAGAAGIVLGILRPDACVDIQRTGELVSLSNPLPVTFHRAFDETRSVFQALEDVNQTGAARILTSGGAESALDGVSAITELVNAAAGRITIVPGAGINADNISRLALGTRAREFHAGLSSLLPYPRTDCVAFERGVREIVDKLRSVIS
jgi:copper homeostasis protein